MLKVDRLCTDFESCLGWPYASPGGTGQDCSRSGIDCSGMFVRAWRLQGERIAHGSNRIWRQHTAERGAIAGTGNKAYPRQNGRSITELERGMAVFKWSPSAPKGYRDGLGDYHHIGLVVSVDPLRIIHASSVSGKVQVDTAIGQWCAWAYLAAVERASAVQKKVRGGRLNVRSRPEKHSRRLGSLLEGSTVTVAEERGKWCRLCYPLTGWVMTEYLEETKGA